MSNLLSARKLRGLMLNIPLFLIFFILLMALPAWVVNGTPDPSWFALYEYHFDQHYQWGIDTIETVGPLGFLHYSDTYSGILHTHKVVFQAVFAGLLSLLILSTCRLFSNTPFKILWLVFSFLGLSSETEMLSTEVFPYLAMLLIAHHVFLLPSNRWTTVRDGLFMFCLAFLVLVIALSHENYKRSSSRLSGYRLCHSGRLKQKIRIYVNKPSVLLRLTSAPVGLRPPTSCSSTHLFCGHPVVYVRLHGSGLDPWAPPHGGAGRGHLPPVADANRLPTR